MVACSSRNFDFSLQPSQSVQNDSSDRHSNTVNGPSISSTTCSSESWAGSAISVNPPP